MAKKKEEIKSTKKNNDQGECKQGAGENSTSSEPAEIQLSDLFKAIFTSFSPEPPEGANKKRDEIIHKYLKQVICSHQISNSYNTLILHDHGRMIKSDADHIYRAAASFSDKKPLLLVLYSAGGVIDSAYLIGKLCRENAHKKFVVVVHLTIDYCFVVQHPCR
jgi:hypothetical protein